MRLITYMIGDKDLMQLITEPNVEPAINMVDPIRFERVGHDEVVTKWGVGSKRLGESYKTCTFDNEISCYELELKLQLLTGDVLALAGDAADNIPGVPGIGPKIAASLINEYGELDNLISSTDEIRQAKRRESIIENAHNLSLYRKLVTLDEEIPISKMTCSLPLKQKGIRSLRMLDFDPDKLINFCRGMELRSCENQIDKRLRARPAPKSPPKLEEYSTVPF